MAENWRALGRCVTAPPALFEERALRPQGRPSGTTDQLIAAQVVRTIEAYCKTCPVTAPCMANAQKFALSGIAGGEYVENGKVIQLPGERHADCQCGHVWAEHVEAAGREHAGPCTHVLGGLGDNQLRCTCHAYRPKVPQSPGPTTPPGLRRQPEAAREAARAVVRPPQAASPGGIANTGAVQANMPSIDAFVRAAARSDNRKIRDLGAKVVQFSEQLRDLLREEREAAEKAERLAQERRAAQATADRLRTELAGAEKRLAEIDGPILATGKRRSPTYVPKTCELCPEGTEPFKNVKRHQQLAHGVAVGS